jgi:hypothetical protein
MGKCGSLLKTMATVCGALFFSQNAFTEITFAAPVNYGLPSKWTGTSCQANGRATADSSSGGVTEVRFYLLEYEGTQVVNTHHLLTWTKTGANPIPSL